jgi:putative ABC transport system permease protein
MGYAVHLINHAAVSEFSQAVRSLMGNADLEIRGPRSGFDEALYPKLVRMDGVAAVSPVVEADARLSDRREALKIVGLDILRASAVHPNLIGRAAGEDADRFTVFDPDAVFLSPAALAWLGVTPGDTLHVQAGVDTIALKVVGTVPSAGEGLRIGVMDIAAVQWRFRRLGVLHRLDLRLRPGIDEHNLRERLARILPTGVTLSTPAENARRTANISRAYRVNLNVLALVALFTGAFLVFSQQALSVVRRRSQLALVRVLGMTRAELLGQILLEGVVLGAGGAAIGLIFGYAMATLVLEHAGADLGGGFFQGVQPTVRVEPVAAIVFFALGLGAAVLGSFAPALEAVRAQPASALRAGDEEAALERLRSPWPGVVVIAIGLLLTRAGPLDGLPIFGYVAIALLLVGSIMLIPRLAHFVFSWLPRPSHSVPALALCQLSGAPGRAAIALGGILASFSLMVAMAIMVASFRISVEQWLSMVLPADLYMRASASGDTGYLPPEEQRLIQETPGIARVEFQRSAQITLDPQRPPVTLLSRLIDPANPGARLPLVGAPVGRQSTDPPLVWVSEAMVDLYGLRTGEVTTLPIGERSVPVKVGAVWRDYARQHGAVVISEQDYRQYTGDLRANEAALWLEPGVGPGLAKQRLRARIRGGEHIEYAEPGEIRAVSLKIFDRSFAVTYLLEAIAVIIGLFGIGASFGSQALARASEFGMLRHVGMTRRQLGAMLALEGALLALLGAACGFVLGWVVALILIHVVNPQSFHWTMTLHVPFRLLGSVAAVLVLTASATAFISARGAMAAGAVRAVREDW